MSERLSEQRPMAPKRLSARVWLRASIVTELLAREDFVPDLQAAVLEAERSIIGQGARGADRLYARFMAWRQARAEGIRLDFVMAERLSQLAGLILAEAPEAPPERTETPSDPDPETET